MHFVLKDHFQSLQIFFYAFPLPILIFLGSIITILFYKPKTYFILFFCMTLGVTGIWFNNAYLFSSTVEIPKDATSVLFWNAANGKQLPIEVLAESIKNIEPDLIALVEAENASAEDILKLSKSFPDYEFQILEGFMFVGVKGSIKKITYKAEEHSYDVNFVEVQLNKGVVSIAITDIFQDPTMDKRKALGTALQFASQMNADIIAGDFNTPYESVHFKNYETDYTSLHDYGQGFTATWFFKVPLLEIDQIFIDKKFAPALLQKFHYSASDHAMLVGYFKK